MHSYLFSRAIGALCLGHSYGVKAPSAAHRKPFIFGKPVVIFGIHYGELALGEGYPAEGVAVPQSAVGQQYPYTEPVYELRQENGYLNRSHESSWISNFGYLLLNFFTGVYLLIRFVELLPLFVRAGASCEAGRSVKPSGGLTSPDTVSIIPYSPPLFNNYITCLKK